MASQGNRVLKDLPKFGRSAWVYFYHRLRTEVEYEEGNILSISAVSPIALFKVLLANTAETPILEIIFSVYGGMDTQSYTLPERVNRLSRSLGVFF